MTTSNNPSSTSSSSSSTSPPKSDRLPMPSRNPMPLSASQEAQVRDVYYARVRGHCAAEIKRFAECASNRTFTATWMCRTERLAMNTCMVAHATLQEQDAAREEWFALRMVRRREREEKEKKRKEQEKFHREWWGLSGEEGGGKRMEEKEKTKIEVVSKSGGR
ncbi:MAG: hypothetical protein M1823_002340 [Watsoniomyces obsoletus]|nr:MAG: hypothetical protein M1823_002340 [Watsoniomyces obsoletus]